MVRPSFKIRANDSDISKDIEQRLLSLHVNEQLGAYSDTLTLTLADHQQDLAIPKTGVELKLALGFHNALYAMGLYIVDEINLKSPPSMLTITARSAPFQRSKTFKAMQSHKTKHLEDLSLATLARTIAAQYQLKASIAPGLEKIHYHHINQQDESDLNLLRRLADKASARLKVTDGKLALIDLTSAQSHKKTPLPLIRLTPTDTTRFNATLAGRTQYKSVIASYRSLDENKTLEVTLGSDEPTRRLPHLFDDKASATQAARARLHADSCGRGSIKLTLPGRADIKAGMILDLQQFRAGINQQWQCVNVEHSFTPNGFSTQLTATTRN